MIKGIHHTAISTSDIERSLSFYKDMLGFEEVAGFSWEKGNDAIDTITNLKSSAGRVALIRIGNAFVELFEFQSPQPVKANPNRPVCDHGVTHICLEVEDVEAEHKRLSTAGMRFLSPPVDAGMGLKAVYGRDPDGNVVELLEVEGKDNPFAIVRN